MMTTTTSYHQGGIRIHSARRHRRCGHGRRAISSSSSSAVAAVIVALVALVVVVIVVVSVAKNDSIRVFTSALPTIMLLPRSHHHCHNYHHPHSRIRPFSSTSPLYLGPMEDLSDYGKNKQSSELDTLTSKREAIKRAKLANIKPNDDEPRITSTNNDHISEDDLRLLLQQKEKEVSGNEDDLFAMPEFKTKRVHTAGGGRGLSSGNYGGDTNASSTNKSSTSDKSSSGSSSRSGDGSSDDNDNNEQAEEGMFMDWTADYDDENEFHIPNRIGITIQHWGNVKEGYVDGKLKKKDRALGRYNKNDLQKAYEKLQRNGISFIETSESYPPMANALLNEFHSGMNYNYISNDVGPMMASTFPNVWRHAFSTRTVLPRRGAMAIVSAAEKSCEQLGISSLSLYQIANPRPFYIGGMGALADGMLDVISDDHSRYVGCVNFHDIYRLVKLQKALKTKGGEFISTNKFTFSLTNRKHMGLIMACKKLGITPLCTNVLDDGLATGRYTSTNPTGGEVSTKEGDLGPYPVRKLEKLDVLFRTQEGLREKINRRIGNTLMKFNDSVGQQQGAGGPKINRDVTTTQIAINYVRAKGAVPLVSVTNVKMANELLGCLGWDLSEEEVEELDKACKSCGI